MNQLLKASSGKNKEKLQKLVTLDKGIMEEICKDFFTMQKLKF